MTEVISYVREKRPKALTPLYIVYVVSSTFNVYDQAGNMYTYNLYVVSCTFDLSSPSVIPFPLPFIFVRAVCVLRVHTRLCFLENIVYYLYNV